MSVRLAAIAICLWGLSCSVLQGQIILSDIRPLAFAHGQETEIRFVGDRLSDAYDVISYTPGITITDFVVREDAKLVTAKIHVPDDFPMGWHALRVVTPIGISDLRTVYVGNLPTATEPREPHPAEQPAPIDFPSVLTGRIAASGEVDAYSFSLEAGQQISIEVQAMRAGRAPVDTKLELLDPEGQLIASCDDTALTKQDPFISIQAPVAGQYTVLLKEARFDGSGRHWYLMHVGSFPRPVLCDPPGAPAGQEIATKLRLPNGEWLEQRTTIPPAEDVGEGSWPLYVTDDRGTSPTPLFFRVSDLPTCEETEPNDAIATANQVEMPTAVHGTIQSENDRDFFKFSGKKGQVLRAQVCARQPLRSALDSLLNVRHASGKNLATNDDAGGPDSRIQLTLPEDDDYVVMIRGQLARPSVERLLIYRLELSPPPPALRLTIPNPRQNVTKTVTVPRGGRAAILLQANRENVQGAVNTSISDLPLGVSHSAADFAANIGRIPIVLEAADDATPNCKLVKLNGTMSGNREVEGKFSLRQLLTRGRNNVELCGVSLDRLATAVTDEAPFDVALVEPQVELVPAGEMKLAVQVRRDEGFTNPITVGMLYNPPGISSPRSITIPGDQDQGTLSLTTNTNPSRGTWRIVLQATANDNRGGKSRQIETCTQLYDLEVADGYFDVELPRANLEQGSQHEYPVKITHKRAFDGLARAELLGLPRGVSAESLQLDSQTESLTFQLNASSDARPGMHSGIRCRLIVEKNGQPITHVLGSAKIRVDRPLPSGDEVAIQESSRE